MTVNKGLGNRISKFIMLLFLLFLAFLCIFPFYWMGVMGTVTQDQIFKEMPLLPGTHIADNYKSLVSGIPFWRAMFNSLYIAVTSTVLVVLVSSMAGYAFSKFTFRGKTFLFSIVMATMMIPVQLGLVAFVWQMNKMGWSDTHWPLIIPGAASGFGVFWMKQYVEKAVYKEILESARIDGCREFTIYASIVLPMIKPAVYSLAILCFMSSWQSFLTPLVILNTFERYTLPIAIAALKGVYRSNYSAQFLGLAMSTFPVLIVFLLGTRTFISGLTAGAVKG